MQNWYRRIVPLDRAQHASFALAIDPVYRFAAGEASLALSYEEFGLASPCFPIVFAAGPTPMPMALVGITKGTNLYVTPSGAWAPEMYIPAVARNYPFLVLDAGDGRELVGIDTESDLFVPVGGRRLFDGDEPTDFLKQRMALCNSFRDSMKRTAEFAKAVFDAGLLEEQEANLTIPGVAEPFRLNGFSVVSQEKLEQMPDKLFLEWRRRGYLTPIYQHLVSQVQWRRLVERARIQPPLAA